MMQIGSGRISDIARAPRTASGAPRVPFALRVGALLLLALLLSSLYPTGYVGGGADDGRYLEAIRCLVAEGYCVPASHWAARLPLVLPAGAVVALLGESRLALSLVPILYAGGALALFALLVRRFAGERAATVGMFALILTPVLMTRWQRLNVDVAELFYLLAGLWLLAAGIDRNDRRPVLLAGAAFGLALLSRTSAVALFPIVAAGLILFTRRGLRWSLLLAAGGSAMLLAEALFHAGTAGDPLLRWRLELGHTRIPSTALPPGIDLSRSPILNPDYIANWDRAAGIRVHWLLDGALNLLADPLVSLTLAAGAALSATLLLGARRRGTAWRGPAARQGWFLLGAVLAHFGILTFVLAVHPTPRMFLPIVCVAAFAIGVWADRRPGREGIPLVAALLAIMLATTAAAGLRSVRLPPYQQEAERWAREHGRTIVVSATAASVFALSPSVSALSRARPWGGGKPVLAVGPGCAGVADRSRLLRTFVHRPDFPLRYELALRLGIAPRRLMLCLVRPAGRAASPRS
jgi:4-amino-4-deoxy-L-arabinose transferase-like glycosyltransferase